MLYSLAAVVLALSGLVAAIEGYPRFDFEQSIEINIQPWDSTTPSLGTYGIGYRNPMIVNYANTEDYTRPITRFTMKVINPAVPAPGHFRPHAIFYGDGPQYLAYNPSHEPRLCRGNMINRGWEVGIWTGDYALRCAEEETASNSAHTDIWTLEGEPGTLTMRGEGLDPKPTDLPGIPSWNTQKLAMRACAHPDWQTIIANKSQAALYYYEKECEIYGLVRVKMTYRVIE